MAFSKSIAFFAALLVVLPMAALAFGWDNIAPTIADEVCEKVECGRGKCKFDVEDPLGFTCECEAGWKRTRDGDDDLKFLPCVIPNCTLDYSCQPAPPPVPAKEIPRNLSAFDPCYWVYCGEGNCVKNETYAYTPICECKSGFSNLLNVSAFPCYNECTLQPDCKSLGITVAKSTSTDNNQATSFLPGKLQLMTMAMVYVGMILWK
ncbi:unnamed protein product [Prunus armeniaca]|uniref:EGF-like domain-containing protein n=1 Tax=Prunus armeniaca TaxID=36596 RepID=A0A6J5XS02_PRUAR|nr:unnamed protein product [Prunus armeniaca]